jgi:hypothetical protein
VASQRQPPDLDKALHSLLCELRHIEGSYRADQSRQQLPELWA